MTFLVDAQVPKNKKYFMDSEDFSKENNYTLNVFCFQSLKFTIIRHTIEIFHCVHFSNGVM